MEVEKDVFDGGEYGRCDWLRYLFVIFGIGELSCSFLYIKCSVHDDYGSPLVRRFYSDIVVVSE